VWVGCKCPSWWRCVRALVVPEHSWEMHRTRRAGLHGCAGGCANRSRERQPVCQRFQLRGWPSSYSDLRRPLSRLMMRITSATTRSRWMSPPAIWKLKPSSHRTKTTTKIVQSMYFSFRAWDASWTSDKLAMFQSVRFDLSMDGNQPRAPESRCWLRSGGCRAWCFRARCRLRCLGGRGISD
jgi:hypothetical protein